MTITIAEDSAFALPELPHEPSGYQGLALDRLAGQVCEVTGTQQSCIMVRDRLDPRVAIAAAAHGMGDDLVGTRLVLDRGPVGHAFAFGRAAAGRGPGSNPYGKTGWERALVTASAPIGSRPHVLGALSATSDHPHRRFTAKELGLLHELAGLAGDALDHAEKRNGELSDLRDQLERVLGSLTSHDQATGLHSAAVVRLASALGERLAMSETSLLELELAALVHDLGKIAVPAEILGKPGPLDESEREIVEQHPVAGAEVLRRIPGLEPVATIVRYHHERWDGQGYPEGIQGERIPLASRIVAVCDAYHAMTSVRAYRPTLDRDAAIAELRRSGGTQFDPSVVERFDASLVDRRRNGDGP